MTTPDNRKPLMLTQSPAMHGRALITVVWTLAASLWSQTPVVWVCAAGLAVWLAQWFTHRLTQRLYGHGQVGATAQDARATEDDLHALLAQQQRLQAQQAEQDRFLGAMGHELRTPMNAILGFHGAMRQHWAMQPEALVRVERIQRTSERLMQHLNRLLDDAKLRAHRLSLQPQTLALAPLLAACLQDRLSETPNMPIDLQAHDAQGVWVNADPVRLKQTLCCVADVLLDSGSYDAVHVTVTREATAWRVRMQAHANPSDAKTQATQARAALALSVATQLVALQRGQLQLDVAHGQATIELPLQEVSAPESAQPAQIDALRAQALHVLVVDDHELNRVVATMMLRKEFPNAHIHSCDNAPDALDWLQHNPCDLVLMDIVMPEMDGMTATRLLRAQAGPHARVPVVAMTGIDQPEDRLACEQAGMNGLLNKPLRANELQHAVLAALSPRGGA